MALALLLGFLWIIGAESPFHGFWRCITIDKLTNNLLVACRLFIQPLILTEEETLENPRICWCGGHKAIHRF